MGKRNLPKRKAKAYTKEQQRELLRYFRQSTRYPARNTVIFLLSLKAGLRAGEISQLCWHHVLNWKGNAIGDMVRVTDDISKNGKGREFDMSNDLIRALTALYNKNGKPPGQDRIVLNHKKNPMTPNGIAVLFNYWLTRRMGWHGYSSHSGRRTFITNAARKINQYGGSIWDVSLMAGHSNLESTQGYIEPNRKAMKRVVNMI